MFCSGALVLGGIFCYSRISAVNAVWGTVLSTLIAVAFGMPAAEIANGVWSFQGALVAMTLCGLFYVVTVTTFINAVWAVIVSEPILLCILCLPLSAVPSARQRFLPRCLWPDWHPPDRSALHPGRLVLPWHAGYANTLPLFW